jgi:hypothetical protein
MGLRPRVGAQNGRGSRSRTAPGPLNARRPGAAVPAGWGAPRPGGDDVGRGALAPILWCKGSATPQKHENPDSSLERSTGFGCIHLQWNTQCSTTTTPTQVQRSRTGNGRLDLWPANGLRGTALPAGELRAHLFVLSSEVLGLGCDAQRASRVAAFLQVPCRGGDPSARLTGIEPPRQS